MGSFGGIFRGIAKKISHGWKGASRGAKSIISAASHQVHGIKQNVPRLVSQVPEKTGREIGNIASSGIGAVARGAGAAVEGLLGGNGTLLAILAIGGIIVLRG